MVDKVKGFVISYTMNEAGASVTDACLLAIKELLEKTIKNPDDVSRLSDEYFKRVKQATQEWEENWRDWADSDILRAYKNGITEADQLVRQIHRGEDVSGLLKDKIPADQTFARRSPALTLQREVPGWMKKEFALLPNHLEPANVFRRAAYFHLEGTAVQIARKADDIYREIAITVTNQTFRESEFFTKAKTAQSIMEEYARKGIQSIIYKDGKKVSIEAYSEMVARTMISQAARQAKVNRVSEYGYDLVRVSSHFRACDLCVPYEGAVLSLSGNSDEYESMDSAVASGLFHPNCLHTFNPYIPGLSPDQQVFMDKYEKKLVAEHGYEKAQEIAYQAQDRQRAIERKIREYDKLTKLAVDEETAQKMKVKMMKWQETMREHIKTYPFLRRDFDREFFDLEKVISSTSISLMDKIIKQPFYALSENDIKYNGGFILEELKKEREEIKKKIDELSKSPVIIEMKKLRDLENKVKAVRRGLDGPEILGLSKFADDHQIIEFYSELKDKIRAIKSSYSKISDELFLLISNYQKTEEENMLELKNLLSSVRNMGFGKEEIKLINSHLRGYKVGKESIKKVYSYLPNDWVRSSALFGQMNVVKTTRGYYRWNDQTMALPEDLLQRTTIHELGHRMEHVFRDLTLAEKTFYKRRTAGEKLSWLGPAYDAREVTRKDDFIDSYIGKDYGNGLYELVSMGMELAYTSPTELWKDEDYAKFIYGILVSL